MMTKFALRLYLKYAHDMCHKISYNNSNFVVYEAAIIFVFYDG